MAPTTQIVVGVASVLLTIVGAVILTKKRKEKIPTAWKKVGTLKELYLYPLKSGTGIKTKKVFCTNRGVKEIEKEGNSIELRDRSFAIYTSKDKEVRTARQIPRAFLIKVQAAENGIILSAPNKKDIFVGIPKIKDDVKIMFGNEPFICTDCGEDVAKWLSEFLLEKDEGLCLGYGDGTTFRNVIGVHKKWAEYYTNMDNTMAGIFSDFAALHIVNQASVDAVNQQLPEDEQISFRNFRPNLLVEGPAAFDEDNWSYIKIGDEVVAKMCLETLRCIETTVSQNGVMNKNRQPMRTLEEFRQSKSPFKKGVMGLYLKVVQTGKICEGDDIYLSK